MLSSTFRFLSSVAALALLTNASAGAADGVRLTTVAAANGFSYEWMPTEGGAMLARPGLRIIIRAGRLFYEINNATPIADSAPRFDGRDLIISAKLARHLTQIAAQYPQTANDTAESTLQQPPQSMPSNETTQARISLSVKARRIPGRETIALTGLGPANTSLSITLTGEISTDLPITILSRKNITTATDGSFSAEVDYGQDSHPGTAIAATVTTLSGSSAQARVIIGVPSPQIKNSGLDDWPKK